MNNDQVNHLTMASAAGSLAGVIVGVIGHLTIGGIVGSIFLMAGTVIGTGVGGAISYATIAYAAKHAKHTQVNPLSDAATDRTYPT